MIGWLILAVWIIGWAITVRYFIGGIFLPGLGSPRTYGGRKHYDGEVVFFAIAVAIFGLWLWPAGAIACIIRGIYKSNKIHLKGLRNFFAWWVETDRQKRKEIWK